MDLGFRIARKYWQIRHNLATALIGPMPVSTYAPSVIASVWDSDTRATPYLVDLSLRAAERARTLELDVFTGRESSEELFFTLWPGEHYRLLTALCQEVQAKTVIEIGTLTGTGTLSLLAGVAPEGDVHTFDILGWDSFDGTWLTKSDFEGGHITQHLDDLSDPESVAKHRALLEKADLIFLDGPKDHITEQKILDNFKTLSFEGRPLFVFDDILTLGMAPTWHGIQRPKLDITSFGHWTGTGIVDWCGEN